MSDPGNPPFGGAALAASSLWAPAGSDWQREYLGFEPVPAAEIAVSEAVASAGSGGSDGGAANGGAVNVGAAASPPAEASAEPSAKRARGCTAPECVPLSELRIPSAAELPAFMARLVEYHGAEAVITQLLKVCPAATLQEACDRAWGVRSDDKDEHSRRCGIGEASLRTPPTAPRPSTAMLDGHSAAAGPQWGLVHKRCWHCEPYAQKQDGQCAAVALLASLEADLEEVTARIAEEEAVDGVTSAARKAARYFLYRKYVGEAWGCLGRGKRVRIPPCVIEEIRDRFREPSCLCKRGGPLARCVAHGYTGHRDAAEATED